MNSIKRRDALKNIMAGSAAIAAAPLLSSFSIETKKEIVVFNNPKANYVTLNMEGFELEYGQYSYQIYDLRGRILKENIINLSETQINLNGFITSIYLLRVYDNNKVLKTFKIIKQ